ncbi:MAG TPA: GTP cyclohydrolase, FolE2/MptA family, partial [Thauera aminoaromatica]|nr:GTP cyclohydrolase, FolE2/MptA family [Thauera aminoaromatica]
MNAPEKFFLPDVQSSADHRALAIQQVGVRGLRYPMAVRDLDGGVQHTVATLEMTVGLPAEVKGTHMSRFVELLEAERDALDLDGLRGLFADMLVRLEAESGRIEARFPWFMKKAAPVSGVESLLDIDARVVVEKAEGGEIRSTLEAVVPVTSLCPCSKKISAYGA